MFLENNIVSYFSLNYFITSFSLWKKKSKLWNSREADEGTYLINVEAFAVTREGMVGKGLRVVKAKKSTCESSIWW